MTERFECPSCGELCRDDVTYSDHGVCYDCHHQMLNGERCRICYRYGHSMDDCPETMVREYRVIRTGKYMLGGLDTVLNEGEFLAQHPQLLEMINMYEDATGVKLESIQVKWRNGAYIMVIPREKKNA